MQLQYKVSVPKWVLIVLVLGVVIGAGVAMAFVTGKFSPEQTKSAIGLGMVFWLLAGIMVWATNSKIEIVAPDNNSHQPNMSAEEWRRHNDRETGWTK